MEEYKEEYNKLLTRYNNGCTYLETHRNEHNKYINNLLNIQSQLNNIIEQHPEMTEEEILKGFKL